MMAAFRIPLPSVDITPAVAIIAVLFTCSSWKCPTTTSVAVEVGFTLLSLQWSSNTDWGDPGRQCTIASSFLALVSFNLALISSHVEDGCSANGFKFVRNNDELSGAQLTSHVTRSSWEG